MTRQGLSDWLRQWWQLIVFMGGALVAFGTLTASVAGKVDKVEFDRHVQQEAFNAREVRDMICDYIVKVPDRRCGSGR